MKIFEAPINELKPLLGAAMRPSDELLVRSIEDNGVLQPLVVCNNIVCDGHRRLAALKSLGKSTASCIEVAGSPALLFLQLNSHRELTAFELAAAYASVGSQDSSAFFSCARTPESPQLQLALRIIAGKIMGHGDLPEQQLPLNVWRELGHLNEDIGRFALPLLHLPGTVSEKRSIATLLRQAQRKGCLPEVLPGTNATEVLGNLQQIAQPRRSSVLEKFTRALEQNPLPAGVSVKIDQTFSQPGMQLTINLTRRNCERLLQTKTAAEAIFAAVEEL
ncbi:MAG: ParB/Srx family N-terminal domain-containing protein [Candidatus Riflebacteria bacterium]|nr:ParB/Srx family N-terminal domain-containing protein [Candidatus Riflebacteria bacterium]